MSERIVNDPSQHGWVEVDGKWMWGAGSDAGGSIQDGDTEGQITTWDGTEWTPEDAVVVSNGNVGIGVSSTPWLLHARSDSGPRIRVENTTDAQASFDLKTATRETRLITDSSSIVRVYDQASNSDKLNIDADGNVGIGVSDLSVTGANAKFAVADGYLNLDEGFGVVWGGGTGRPNIHASKADGLSFSNATTEIMTIDADGNVNITGKLFINGEEVTAGGGGGFWEEESPGVIKYNGTAKATDLVAG